MKLGDIPPGESATGVLQFPPGGEGTLSWKCGVCGRALEQRFAVTDTLVEKICECGTPYIFALRAGKVS